MAVVEIPLTPNAQTFSVTLAGVSYRMRLMWNDAAGGFWALDIGRSDGTLILAGVPLVTGADLLEQHTHLGIGGGLIVTSDRDAGDLPTRSGLGTTSHLYFVTPD